MNAVRSAEVYTAGELARAAGVPAERVDALMATGELPSLNWRYVTHHDAVIWGRRLRNKYVADAGKSRVALAPVLHAGSVSLFESAPQAPRRPGMPAAVSMAAHLLVGGAAVFFATAGLDSAGVTLSDSRVAGPLRLVYLALPGPGGGGGGGGRRQQAPPPTARQEGRKSASSPIPILEPPPPVEAVRETPPPDVPPEPIVAPVATSPADPIDRPGVLETVPTEADSRGPGDDGGLGSGTGAGIGQGDGSGIGPGTGGGIGGGPYRPGSGITPPRLLKEVKPTYTEEARKRRVMGAVVLEIVVRVDGTVGDVRILEGLGSGLDQRAIEAVKQWRFAPAQRLGRPVDLLVEVAVEFRLR